MGNKSSSGARKHTYEKTKYSTRPLLAGEIRVIDGVAVLRTWKIKTKKI